MPDGRVYVPCRAESDDGWVIGDGYVLVDADSAEATSSERWTVDASPEMVEAYEAETRASTDDEA